MGSAAGSVGYGGGGDLFRSEALQAQQTRWLGEIHIAAALGELPRNCERSYA